MPAVTAQSAAAKAAPARNIAAEISRMRTAWTADSAELARIIGDLRVQCDVLGSVTPDLATARRDLTRLIDEKRRAMDEMRSGAFCTGCGRTRSELLAAGDVFPHPGQQSRPATPEELARAEKLHDDRIAKQRDRINDLADREKDAQSALAAAYHRWLVRLPQYHTHILDERGLRLEQWMTEKSAIEADLQQTQQNLQLAQQALNTAPPSAPREPLAREVERLQREMTSRNERARAAESRADGEARTFGLSARGDMGRLAGLAAPLPERFGYAGGAFMATRVRISPLPVEYLVPRVARFDASAAKSGVSELLEPGAKSKPEGPKSQAEKSVRDLLHGK